MTKLFFMPTDVAIEPKEGHAWVNRWWIHHPTMGIAFYKIGPAEFSPQCNQSKEVCENLLKNKIYDGCDVIFLPVVFKGNIKNVT